MQHRFLIALLLGFALRASLAAGESAKPAALANWPQWRGPLANGVAPEADPPLSWSETNHVKWKVAVPGRGTSTPIVWQDRVFLLAAIPPEAPAETKAGDAPPPPPPASAPGDGPGPRRGPPRAGAPKAPYQFATLCYDRKTGKELWRKIAREVIPHEGHHPDHGFASASPSTDGERLIVYFGSRGLHCYDLNGNLNWSKDLGKMQTRNSFGEGASPALHGKFVVVNWDDETDNDFIAAFDKTTGEEIWRTPRREATGWSTPLIVEQAGKFQVIVNATQRVRSYDLATGKEIWQCGGQTANSIPSPVAAPPIVYCTSGYQGSALYAISMEGTGDVTGTAAVSWSYKQNTPYVPSPLLTDGLLYIVKGNMAVLTCLDAKTGSPHFEAQRLEGTSGIYASPVSARDRVYVLGRDGTCLVLKKGPAFEVLARNKVEDKTDASLALVGREIFLRGHNSLYCIDE
jgi:outer membrane protein assembly factor BamB